MTPLEKRYRRLLAWYPRDHRAVHEEEMVSVLLAGANSSRRRLGFAETFDLLHGALALHLRRALGRNSFRAWLDACAVVGVVGAVLLLAQSASIFTRGALAASIALWSGRGMTTVTRPDVLFPLLAAVVLAVAVATGRRWCAAGAAWAMVAVQVVGLDSYYWSLTAFIELPGIAAADEYVPLLLAVTTALALTIGPARRRGHAAVGRGRLLLLGGLVFAFTGFAMTPLSLGALTRIDALRQAPLMCVVAIAIGLALASPVGRRAVVLLALPMVCQVVGLVGQVFFTSGEVGGVLLAAVPVVIVGGFAIRATRSARGPLDDGEIG